MVYNNVINENIKIIEFDTENVLKLEYVKNYLRIDNNKDDEFLKNAISTATLYAEKIIGKIIGEKQIEISFYAKKDISKIEKNNIFINEVISFNVNDEVLESNNYYLQNGKILLNHPINGNIKVCFKTGNNYINEDIKQAVLYHIATIYQNKNGSFEIPKATMEIYNSYRDIKI